MAQDNLRHQAVKSLMLAIDLENENKDVEAYLKYLDGLSLVVTALQKDATSGGKWLFTDKDRRSMVNFAKESVERLTHLLKKQDDISAKKHEEELLTLALKRSQQASPESGPLLSPMEVNIRSLDSDQRKLCSSESTSPISSASGIIDFIPSIHPEEVTLNVDMPLSPLEVVQQENIQLTKKFAQRLLNAPACQKPQLRLELERHLVENMAIAKSAQQMWEAQREKAVQHYSRLAEQKCRLHQKNNIGTGDILNAQLKDAIISCYMFEWDRKLRVINGTMEIHPKLVEGSSPESERRTLRKSLEMATRALRGSIRGHPLGSILVQKQQCVCKDISTLLSSHDFSEESPTESNVFLDSFGSESTGATGIFNKVAKGIISDLEFLEAIVLSLYEPLNTVEGHQTLYQNLQKVYFPAITPTIKSLLRLCVIRPRSDFPGSRRVSQEDESSAGASDISLMALNSLEFETRFRLQSLQSLSSPCEKLDCLMEVMRSLCSWKYSYSPEETKKTPQPIGADDLLSRLVSVIRGSENESPDSLVPLLQMEAIFLQAFLPEEMVLGEAGYCVTVLCSALAV
ncbi:VPS9 domain-containing protein 1-like [Hetaerina americana]|uniref:VPS9 domain-containing protein 1-like n=1 Tax=Hetaerina americana TaxID=62018 RepID=UPI003A7F50DB